MINCPSCSTQVDTSINSSCPACGLSLGARGGPTGGIIGPGVVKAGARPKVQCEVVVAYAVDRTGSGERFQAGVNQIVETISNQVAAKARDVKVFVQTHGDLDEGEQPVLLTDGGTVAQAIQDVRSIVFNGGGDPPEHHLDAIENLVNTIPWPTDPSRARAAVIGLLTADTKPARSGVTAQQLGEAIKTRGLLLYLICEPTPTLYELVQAAGGLLFEISNTPDPTALQAIATQLSASIVASIAKGGTLPMTALPAAV
jgi:hypothetical protein